MRTNFILPSRYHGRVIVSNGDGVVVEGHNDVVYQGADVLANLAAGNATYRISHMYFEFQNTVTPAADAFALTDTAISRQGVTGTSDLIRAPLIAAPSISSTGEDYASNQVIFHSLTTVTTGLINDLDFDAGADSHVVSMCLVAAPGGSNHLQDLIYARFILASPLPVSGSTQISGTWPTTWN